MTKVSPFFFLLFVCDMLDPGELQDRNPRAGAHNQSGSESFPPPGFFFFIFLPFLRDKNAVPVRPVYNAPVTLNRDGLRTD